MRGFELRNSGHIGDGATSMVIGDKSQSPVKMTETEDGFFFPVFSISLDSGTPMADFCGAPDRLYR